MSGNTILITGGNSGIGRSLAEALHARGNKIIITGRDAGKLSETLSSNPGMISYVLDVTNPSEITSFAQTLVREHPSLNVLINNAGIMQTEDFCAKSISLDVMEKTINTNLMAPIRLSAALLPHLRSLPDATLVFVSSGLAFVPRADTPNYSLTKAAIHSLSQSLRHQLQDTSVNIVELAPPLVATELIPGQSQNAHALPLDDFIAEVMSIWQANPDIAEILVDRVLPMRNAENNANFDTVFRMINSAS